MPYTSLYLSGLHIGMDAETMRSLPLTRLVLMVRAHNEMIEPGEKGEETREATQQDIRTMLM